MVERQKEKIGEEELGREERMEHERKEGQETRRKRDKVFDEMASGSPWPPLR